MVGTETVLRYFGAHVVPGRDEHERERALLRAVVCALITLVWLGEMAAGNEVRRAQIGLLFFCIGYAAGALVYRSYLKLRPQGGVLLQYVFLVADPFMLVDVLAADPEHFAFLNSLIAVVIVRCGIRYGVRTMWLVWGFSALFALVAIPASDYWRAHVELSLTLAVTLGLLPLLFQSLIQRVHRARLVEHERVRVAAMSEAVATRSAFLAKVSHELRSPLQSIVSALDLFEMRHGHGIGGDDELIARMRRSSMLLNTQLRDLLTLAKGQAGRLDLRPEPFEACSLAEGVALAAREGAREKGLELDVELPPEPIFAVADAARIDQILSNLVANAVKYTESGRVRLVLQPYDHEHKRLHFTISDTGPGMPESKLATLFEPKRLFESEGGSGKSSGIGLAVVRTLVEHLSGKLAVESQVGCGTSIAVEVPAELIEEESSNDCRRTNRVLIVDDNPDVLTALTSVVHELGYQDDRAPTAAVALNLAAAREYAAILIDIDMPQMSGAQLAAEIRRRDGSNRHARILGMSAAEIARPESVAGFDAYLQKPIDRNALFSALRAEWPESWPSSIA